MNGAPRVSHQNNPKLTRLNLWIDTSPRCGMLWQHASFEVPISKWFWWLKPLKPGWKWPIYRWSAFFSKWWFFHFAKPQKIAIQQIYESFMISIICHPGDQKKIYDFCFFLDDFPIVSSPSVECRRGAGPEMLHHLHGQPSGEVTSEAAALGEARRFGVMWEN